MSTKDWIEKDYYKVLGVSKDATPRRSRRLTASWRETTTRTRIPATLLPNSASRRSPKPTTCCRTRPSARSTTKPAGCLEAAVSFPRGGGARTSGPSVDDLFRNAGGGLGDIFGGLFNGAPTTQTTRVSTARGPRRGSDVEGEVTVDFVQAIEGVTVGMQMVSDTACDACRGTGARAGTIPRVCPTCEGSGMQTSTSGGVFAVTEPCRECRGRGMVVDDPCPVCLGSGRGKSTKTMQVRIPAGVTDGQRIRLKGRGGLEKTVVPLATCTSSCTYARIRSLGVRATTSPLLRRSPSKRRPWVRRSRCRRRWPTGQAAVVTRDAQWTHPAGTRQGVRKRDGTKGDLLVTVEVLVPQALNDQAREALNSYAEAVGTVNPRAKLFAAG